MALARTWNLRTSAEYISSLIAHLCFQVKKVAYLNSVTEQWLSSPSKLLAIRTNILMGNENDNMKNSLNIQCQGIVLSTCKLKMLTQL